MKAFEYKRVKVLYLIVVLLLSSCSTSKNSDSVNQTSRAKPTIEMACVKFQNFNRTYSYYTELKAQQLEEAADIFKDLVAEGIPVAEYVSYANTLAILYRDKQGMDYSDQNMMMAFEKLLTFCPGN